MKREIKRLIFSANTILLFASCESGLKGGEHLKAVAHNDALSKAVQAGGIEYTFKVLTPESVALKDSYTDRTLDEQHYRSRLDELKNYLYIHIEQRVADRKVNTSVLKYQVTSLEQYQQRVQYYEFAAQKDIRLLCGDAELVPVAYQYENHLDVSPVNTLVMAFPRCSSNDDWQVVFNDRVMGNYLLKANFRNDVIAQLPAVTLK
jgi:hypothetical protein